MLYETIVSRTPVPSWYAAANGLYCLHTARSTCGSDRALRARCMSQAYPSTALRRSPSPKAAYAASGEVFASSEARYGHSRCGTISHCLHTARSTCGSDRALRARCMSQAYPSTALRRSPSPKAAYAASGEVFASSEAWYGYSRCETFSRCLHTARSTCGSDRACERGVCRRPTPPPPSGGPPPLKLLTQRQGRFLRAADALFPWRTVCAATGPCCPLPVALPGAGYGGQAMLVPTGVERADVGIGPYGSLFPVPFP